MIVAGVQRGVNRPQFSLCLWQGDSRTETRKNGRIAKSLPARWIDEEPHVRAHWVESELRRHHRLHCAGLSIEIEALADRAGVGSQCGGPKPVTHDQGTAASLRELCPTEKRRSPKQFEGPRAYNAGQILSPHALVADERMNQRRGGNAIE